MQSGILTQINYPVPKLILGTRNWGELVDLPEARSQVRTYLETGGFALELTDNPKALAIAGELLPELTTRDSFQVYFNLPSFRNSAQAQSTLNNALSQANLDHFDIVWTNFDIYRLSIDEIVRFMKQNLNSEKLHYFGLHHTAFWQVAILRERLRTEKINLAGLKTNWSLLQRELNKEELKACNYLNCSLVATKPLAMGLLTGKYRFNTPSDSLLARGDSALEKLLTTINASKVEAVSTAASGIGVSPTEVAMAWVLQNPAVSASVINARNTAQLNQIFQSLKLSLPEELLLALDEVGDFD